MVRTESTKLNSLCIIIYFSFDLESFIKLLKRFLDAEYSMLNFDTDKKVLDVSLGICCLLICDIFLEWTYFMKYTVD